MMNKCVWCDTFFPVQPKPRKKVNKLLHLALEPSPQAASHAFVLLSFEPLLCLVSYPPCESPMHLLALPQIMIVEQLAGTWLLA